MVGMTDSLSVLARARQTLLRTQALYDLARTLMAAGSEEDVLQRTVSAPVELLGVNRSVLITLDSGQRAVQHFLVTGPGSRYVQRPSWDELMGGLTGWAVRERQVALSPTDYLDPREGPEAQERRRQTHCGAIVVLPLLVEGAVYGTLTVINTPQVPDFSDEEVAWLEALGFQLTTALEGLRRSQRPHPLQPFDALTGLPGPLLAEDRLRQAVFRSEVSGRPFALLLLNLDRLAWVNGQHGRAAGDELLVGVAARLREAVRPPDTVARPSGDEFLLLLEDLRDGRDLAAVVEMVTDVLCGPFSAGGERLTVTASVGGALYPTDGRDAAALGQHARSALEEAKRRTRQAPQDPREPPGTPQR